MPVKKIKNNLDSEKAKVLKLAMDKIDKDFGKGAVMIMGEKPKYKYDIIPTGSIGLDKALGLGGLPKGRIVEIYGPESSGKTTLAIHIMAQAQRLGGTVAVIDVEHAFDSNYATNLGVDVNNLLISQPDYAEQGLAILDRLIDTGTIDVIVVDSVAALVPKSELEGEPGDSKMGLQARLMGQTLRMITGKVSKKNVLVIFINQIREKIGVMFGNPETTPGGNALKFYSSIRLDVRKVGVTKDGEESTGTKVKVKVAKNKCAPPYKTAEFEVEFGKGIDRLGEILDVAVGLEIVLKSGSWFSYKGDKLGQGRDTVKQLFRDNKDFFQEVKKEVLANYLKS